VLEGRDAERFLSDGFLSLTASKPLRIARRRVNSQQQPDVIDCIGFYVETEHLAASESLGENVAGAAA
jgi:hypothetical protein